jgi:hypothetical protein
MRAWILICSCSVDVRQYIFDHSKRQGHLALWPHLQLDGVTHCAATLRYIELGVRNSDDSEVQIGTRLGALESFAAEERTLRIASREGCMVTCSVLLPTLLVASRV